MICKVKSLVGRFLWVGFACVDGLVFEMEVQMLGLRIYR